MGYRNAGIGEAADPGCDTRHDAERDARSRKSQGLLSTTPEDAGVAALEPQYPGRRLRASWTNRAEMSGWRGDGRPPRLPANSSCVPGRARARMRSSTRAS